MLVTNFQEKYLGRYEEAIRLFKGKTGDNRLSINLKAYIPRTGQILEDCHSLHKTVDGDLTVFWRIYEKLPNFISPISKEDYEIKLRRIDSEAKGRKLKLNEYFALSNNPHKIGDTIKDHCSTIKIDKIDWRLGYPNNIPECIYRGAKLKKDGSAFKNGDIETIWQSNIETN